MLSLQSCLITPQFESSQYRPYVSRPKDELISSVVRVHRRSQVGILVILTDNIWGQPVELKGPSGCVPGARIQMLCNRDPRLWAVGIGYFLIHFSLRGHKYSRCSSRTLVFN